MTGNPYDEILTGVISPGQYIGGEWNEVRKSRADVDVSLALAFPDTYAIGMSHLGFHMLYELINSLDFALCERVFAPWTDYEDELQSRSLPLATLETSTPLKDFDFVGFSLQYELCLTNVLQMLALAGIPVESSRRADNDPLVLAGGPGAFNPEPMADFVDVFFIGDAEETLIQFLSTYRKLQARGGLGRLGLLRALATTVPGIYAPALYEPVYDPGDGCFVRLEPLGPDVPFPVEAGLVRDLDASFHPRHPVVPFTKTVHDRIAIEIMRGCPQACRFCQASMTKSPRRWRSVERILEIAQAAYDATGHNEIALLSLSSSDYPDLLRLINELQRRFAPLGVNVSLPSLRVDADMAPIVEAISNVRKSGLTFAPEAAIDRLRTVIGKHLAIDDLFAEVNQAYASGWDTVKLYFMIGLPTETDDDILAIPDLCNRVSRARRGIGKKSGKVNVSISSFVPKPHTPFQWEPMASIEELKRKIHLIKNHNRNPRVWYKFNDPEMSFLEGFISRGDRRLGRVILEAWRAGAHLDAWREMFSSAPWLAAIDQCAVDPSFYVHRRRDVAEPLPWDHITVGHKKSFLLRQHSLAFAREDGSH